MCAENNSEQFSRRLYPTPAAATLNLKDTIRHGARYFYRITLGDLVRDSVALVREGLVRTGVRDELQSLAALDRELEWAPGVGQAA